MSKNKYFPCWVCKGQGGWKEIVLDDGSGPFDECGYCEGEGLIKIGGEIHRKRKRQQLALIIIDFLKPKQEEWTYEELQEIGEKALNSLQQEKGAKE